MIFVENFSSQSRLEIGKLCFINSFCFSLLSVFALASRISCPPIFLYYSSLLLNSILLLSKKKKKKKKKKRKKKKEERKENGTDLVLFVLFKDGGLSLDSLQRACTFEAELALLLRISHRYGKSGAQVLFSMGLLQHLASGRAINLQVSAYFPFHTKCPFHFSFYWQTEAKQSTGRFKVGWDKT